MIRIVSSQVSFGPARVARDDDHAGLAHAFADIP
jgi:hypothetical protein